MVSTPGSGCMPYDFVNSADSTFKTYLLLRLKHLEDIPDSGIYYNRVSLFWPGRVGTVRIWTPYSLRNRLPRAQVFLSSCIGLNVSDEGRNSLIFLIYRHCHLIETFFLSQHSSNVLPIPGIDPETFCIRSEISNHCATCALSLL